GVLNIGRLGKDIDAIVDYYRASPEGEDHSIPSASSDQTSSNKKSSTESYYLNNANGRWVGSLRERLGVDGVVTDDAFRLLLEGRHPLTAEPLTPGARNAVDKHVKRAKRPIKNAGEKTMTAAQAAKRLDLSERHVRRLLEQGSALDDEGKQQTWSY